MMKDINRLCDLISETSFSIHSYYCGHKIVCFSLVVLFEFKDKELFHRPFVSLTKDSVFDPEAQTRWENPEKLAMYGEKMEVLNIMGRCPLRK